MLVVPPEVDQPCVVWCYVQANGLLPFHLQPVTWRAAAYTFGVGAILLGGMLYVKREKDLGWCNAFF